MGIFREIIGEEEREKILEGLSSLDPSWAEKLKKLVERGDKLKSEGNFYGEVYTDRQWDIALTPIFNKERVRLRILSFMKEKGEPVSVKEISDSLGIPGKLVLFSLVELRRRRVVELCEVRETTPFYKLVGG